MRLGFHLGPVSVSSSSRRKRKGETGAGPFIFLAVIVLAIGGWLNSVGGTTGIVLMCAWFGLCVLTLVALLIAWLRN
jgi:hypothetical protein